MLTIKELVPALKMAQAVGDRAYGHFDHDANAISGPVPSIRLGSTPSRAAPSLSPQGKPTVSMRHFDVREDPVTGELLYYPC